MPYKAYWATSLTGGGTGALDKIPGTDLADKDVALVILSTGDVYEYWLDIDSAAAESSPDVIAPDNNGGDKRWLLKSINNQDVSSDATVTFGTVNALTLAAIAVGFTIAGGTTSKILTVDETESLSNYHTDARGDARYYTQAAINIWRSNVLQQEMDYLDGVTSDIQDQLDARCLESVLGTSIGASLLLTSTVLSVSAILKKYHAIDPTANVQSLLGAANYAAMMALLSGTATAAFSMNTQKITNVVDPTSDQEAATKKYVDDNAGGSINYRIATGETITIEDYEQLLFCQEYIIEGTGVLTVNDGGILCVL